MKPDILMQGGKIFRGERAGELIDYIMNKFSSEKLNYDEAIMILNEAKERMGQYSIIEKRL